MNAELKVLRTLWNNGDYKELKSLYSPGLDSYRFDIEELILLEFCSYEYEKRITKAKSLEEKKRVHWQEEQFRSKLRIKRQQELSRLIEGIKLGRRNLQDISFGFSDPIYLFKALLRLSKRYYYTLSLPKSHVNPQLMDKIYHAIEEVLKLPSKEKRKQ
ncbi:hypothetical protein GF312_13470, partial [Candidatus Poribacteria bacterium]|nr:hypothetical protein [Candidatus Poribacteria bacterium]